LFLAEEVALAVVDLHTLDLQAKMAADVEEEQVGLLDKSLLAGLQFRLHA
jgi:hypothetical protein